MSIGPKAHYLLGPPAGGCALYDWRTMPRTNSTKGVTAVETVMAVAILSIVGLLIGQVFTRANRMSIDSRMGEKAVALGEMALEQYNAEAALGVDRLPEFDRDRARPGEFFGAPDDAGYDGLLLTTKAEADPESSVTRVTVRVSWGGGLFPPTISFTKIYPHWMPSGIPAGHRE